jgi:hypothetical protein
MAISKRNYRRALARGGVAEVGADLFPWMAAMHAAFVAAPAEFPGRDQVPPPPRPWSASSWRVLRYRAVSALGDR